MVEEFLCVSFEFVVFWWENEVILDMQGVKIIWYLILGEIQFEYLSFGVDG